MAEGETEATAMPAAARRLAELAPATYVSFEALGLCVIDAGSDSQIADLSDLYVGLGKEVYGLCDNQADEQKVKIEASVTQLFMHSEKGFEDLVLKNTTQEAIERFVDLLEWPPHLSAKYPDPKTDAHNALKDYFSWAKGNWGIADFLAQCSEAEIPEWIRDTCKALADSCQYVAEEAEEASEAEEQPNADLIGDEDSLA